MQRSASSYLIKGDLHLRCSIKLLMIGRHTNLADRVTLCISHGKHDMITIVVALNCVTDAYRYAKPFIAEEMGRRMRKKINRVIVGTIISIVVLYSLHWLSGIRNFSTINENMSRVELSANVKLDYITNGVQTELSSEHKLLIENEIEYSENTVELLKSIFEWKKSKFKSEHAKGEFIGTRTAADIIDEMTTTGCHDDGLLISSILRHYQVPCVMVDTVGVNWISKYNNGRTKSFDGHVFIEIFYDDRCFLFDSTLGKLIIGYNPNDDIIPSTLWLMDKKGFYTMYKGIDPAAYGINSLRELCFSMSKTASELEGEEYVIPDYEIVSIKKIIFDD